MENSKIEWTDHTWNPWMGCTKVSDGCKHCYAESLMDHRYHSVKWGLQGTRKRTSVDYWRKPFQWNSQAQAAGRRYRVFCASLADVFEDRPELETWRADMLRMIHQTRDLDWLLLTKRPENVNRMTERATGFSESTMWFGTAPHVWIGTSVENQAAADKRIPELLSIPAKVHFLSIEPLLGSVTLVEGIDWVIVGGESGQGARPMSPEWARSLRDQCKMTSVPFFFKQWGGINKQATGRLLDGVEYSEFPQ